MEQQQIEDVCTAPEAEAWVQQLQSYKMDQICSRGWIRQHEILQKLTQQVPKLRPVTNIKQAHMNAMLQKEEFVVEFLYTHNKFPVLIHELIAVELWKAKVLPEVRNDAIESLLYFVVFHEMVISNILELSFFNKDACVSAGEYLVDLVDYCARKLVWLSTNNPPLVKPDGKTETSLEDKMQNLELALSLKCFGLIRFIADNIKELALSVMNRVLNFHDIICTLVNLLVEKPWIKREGRTTYQFVENKWEVQNPKEKLKLTKTDAQIWLTLYNLLLEPECRRKYYFTTNNKQTVLKLKNLVTETLTDQLPLLNELRVFLEQLTVFDPPPPTELPKAFIIEQIPEIHANLSKSNWPEVIANVKAKFANPTEVARTISEIYQKIETDPIKEEDLCANSNCRKLATKRCSKCKKARYCSRECQSAHWSTHKKYCE